MSKDYPLSEFFNNELPAYGSYDNVRKIASYVDGFKISQRKVIYTLIKKYPKDWVKTENLANVAAAFTNYLHGANNLTGVVGTMTQAFVGANNYALIDGNSGGFGTRIDSNIAAARYTRNALNDLVKVLLDTKDEEIVGRQFFEGDYIEPKFFVPVFPILFLNGSHGLSTGFSQDIWPRNPSEVIEYIKKKIGGTDKPRMALLPWFKGHQGKVAYNKELDRNESFGVVIKNNMTSYTITELPIGIEYQKYVEFLDKLCENGTIQDYTDKCDPKTDKILFELKTSREFTRKHEQERSLMEALHLVKSLPETLCCIDENNRVREFSSVQDILDAYIKVRLEYYNLRKKYLLEVIRKNLEELSSKYLFVKAIIDKTIIVANKKKDDIVKQIEKQPKILKQDGSYTYLLNMQLWSLTVERLDELKKQIENKNLEFKKIKDTAIENMWIEDLKALKNVL